MREYFTSIKLKLYKPSIHKKSVIDEAMVNYTKAFYFLLQENKLKLKDYEKLEGRYRASMISKLIIKHYSNVLKSYNIEPFIDSLALDVGALIGSYLSLKQSTKASAYPEVFGSEEAFNVKYDNLLNSLVNEKGNWKGLDKKLFNLIEKQNKLRSIYFCRYSEKRNYSLLYNPEANRYYVKLYLMNGKNVNRKKIAASKGKQFYYINKDRELFKDGKSKKCYIIVPLCFGNFQEKELVEALKHPEIIKTARLTKENDEYFLIINLKKSCPQDIIPESYMGISRGMYNVVNYSIVNLEGELITSDALGIENKHPRIDELHKFSKEVIKIALDNKSQIILEKLYFGDGLTLVNKDGVINKPILNISNYNRFTDILKYKLEAYGLPKPIFVSSIDIFSSCPSCHNNSKENRFSDKLIICTSCGMVIDIEKTGSLNLSKKLIKYSKDKIIFKAVNVQNSVEFVNNDLEFTLRPENPFDCADELKAALDNLIESFHDNFSTEKQHVNFKKKISMIKKLEHSQNYFDIIEIK